MIKMINIGFVKFVNFYNLMFINVIVKNKFNEVLLNILIVWLNILNLNILVNILCKIILKFNV